MSFTPTAHPVLELPSIEQAMAMGSERFRQAMVWREKVILAEKNDPFGKGWEPGIWRVADALMGYPWVDKDWAERMRRRLGFDRPVNVLLAQGGNRAGKSQWASKRVMRVIRMKPGARAWALHSKDMMSIQYQQPLLWLYMPAELKLKKIQTDKTYVAYKQQTGFSGSKFTLPNLSDCSFLNYEMDRGTIEGGNLDIIWPDELVPPDWVETMELRIAEKNGWMPITFTPVNGYSQTVQLFLDGAEVVKDCPAYLCPTDGGPPDVARALGLTEEELAELKAADREKRAARCPQCRPENCDLWLEEPPSQGAAAAAPHQQRPPDGREFERVPRVMKCAGGDGKRAVIFFYSSDNPYGNPKNIWETISSKSQSFIKERFYGFTTRTMTARFPKFDLRVHVIRPGEVPALGTRYHKVDPSSGRNFFMLWFIVTPEAVVVYREWPGTYFVPGVGVPGAWAEPDGKKLDGRPGPAQKPFGFGNIAYKLELARLEGWRDYERDKEKLSAGDLSADDKKLIADWDETNGAREAIAEREMDSRFASVPKNENDRPTTLLTDFENINVWFTPAPAGEIAEGVQLINDALDYDVSRPVDFFNKPRLLISADCPNLIYSLRTWTGQDGQKGASKDPVDVLRWFFQGENPFVGDARGNEEEGENEDEGLPRGSKVLLGKDWSGEEGRHY